MLRRSLIAALSLAAIVLTGCTDTTRIPPADPTPTDAPLFSSDEEALAAATEVYEEYLAAADLMFSEPADADPLGLDAVSGLAAQELEETVARFREEGLRIEGARSIRNIQLQSYSSSVLVGEVALYACEDVTEVDLLNSDGVSQVAPDRDPLSPFEIVVIFRQSGGTVDERSLWDGGGICE